MKKEEIINILNEHKIYVDNWNDAVFQDSFDEVAEAIIKLHNKDIPKTNIIPLK